MDLELGRRCECLQILELVASACGASFSRTGDWNGAADEPTGRQQGQRSPLARQLGLGAHKTERELMGCEIGT